MIDLIIRLNLKRIEQRIRESHAVSFTWDDAVVKLVASRCTEHESGGRMIDAILTNTLLPALSGVFLTRMAEGRSAKKVHVAVKAGELSYVFD